MLAPTVNLECPFKGINFHYIGRLYSELRLGAESAWNIFEFGKKELHERVTVWSQDYEIAVTQSEWNLTCHFWMYCNAVVFRLVVDCLLFIVNGRDDSEVRDWQALLYEVLYYIVHALLIYVVDVLLSRLMLTMHGLIERHGCINNSRIAREVTSGLVITKLGNKYANRNIRIVYRYGDDAWFAANANVILLPKQKRKSGASIVATAVHELGHAISYRRGGLWWCYAELQTKELKEWGVAMLKVFVAFGLIDKWISVRFLGCLLFCSLVGVRSLSLHEEYCASKLGRECFEREYEPNASAMIVMKERHDLCLLTYFVFLMQAGASGLLYWLSG